MEVNSLSPYYLIYFGYRKNQLKGFLDLKFILYNGIRFDA